MTAAQVAHPATNPWVLRISERARVAPVWTGLAISVASFGVYLLYSAAFGDGPGRFAELDETTWASEVFWSLLLGMAPVVTAYTLRGAARDLEDLAPALRLAPGELESLHAGIARVPRGWVWVAGFGGVAFGLLSIALNPNIWLERKIPAFGAPALTWLLARNALNSALLARAAMYEFLLARAFSRLGERLAGVDLLDRAPLAPFGRRGLRSVLLWMLLLSLFAPFYALGTAEPTLSLGLLLIVALAVAAFLLPLWGAHRRIQAAKHAELARVRGRIREARARPDAAPGGHLADLVAWEQRVTAASDWPFGATALRRLALYTAIGLGSWVGAALVERVLDSALG